MKVLLIGAGAVGIVYGRHLQLGGAEVSYLVREKYLEDLGEGITVYPSGGPGPARAFTEFSLISTLAQVAAQSWDQVWLCVSATALQGDWLEETLSALDEHSVLVALQPGIKSRSRLLDLWPEERLIFGLISMISYQAPLPEQTMDPPGIAYWFPPFAPSPFSGSAPQLRELVSTLRRGGCPATRTRDATAQTAAGSALLMPTLVALEAAGWSLAKLRRSPGLPLACAGAREAQRVVAAFRGRRPSFLRHLARPWLMRLVLALAPRLVPLPLEPYLRYHFTKVGDQTRFMIQCYIEEGERLGLPITALQQLAGLLDSPSPG